MKKRIVSVLLIATMSVGLFSGCGKSGGNTEVKQNENSNKITLMTQDTTYGKAFDEYIHKAEEATGLEIETIACPTNTDDRQAKITTILSSGDDSIDVVTINDEMMSGFKKYRLSRAASRHRYDTGDYGKFSTEIYAGNDNGRRQCLFSSLFYGCSCFLG